MNNSPQGFIPLPEPVPITEQVWPEGTVPLVCTRTMTYMHADFIRPCIESLLMQRTTFPVRVVIHDDASTDGTTEIVREYAAKYPQLIRAILQPENTYSKPNRQQLRAELRQLCNVGKYNAFCEGDDYWTDPLKLQQQVEVLEADPTLSGVFHYTEQSFEGLEGKGKVYGRHGDRVRFTLEDTISALALLHLTSFMFRTAVLSFPPWSTRIGSGDMILFALVASSGDLQCIPKVMSVYRKHPGGITTTDRFQGARIHQDRILLWLHLDHHFAYRYTARCQAVIDHHWQHILWQATPRQRLRLLGAQVRAIPRWFLRHPGVLIKRLFQVLR